jgi:hypothetical protein
VTGDPARADLAAAEGLPVARWYRVLRVDEDGTARNVARVPAGVAEYTDRLNLDELADGLRYSVEVLTEDGAQALPPPACALSNEVRADLRGPRALAAAGIAALERPTRVERDRSEELKDPNSLAAARGAFQERSPGDRGDLLAAWWQATPEARRRAWLSEWVDLFTAAERREILARPPVTWCERDRGWVLADVWLTGEPPEVRDEVDRWWRLLDAPARQQAVERFQRAANRNLLTWLARQHADAGGNVDWGALRPVRLRTWVASRDEKERAELDTWWSGLAEEERRRPLNDWYQSLHVEQRQALHFPDWTAFAEAEKAARLRAPPPLPAELWRHFLAHVAWRDRVTAGGAQVMALLESDVGGLARALTGLRYATRRLDVALGFQLRAVAAVSVVALGLLLARWIVVRRRRARAL